MADAAVAAPAPAEGAQADTPFWQKLFRTIFVWWLISTAVKHFTGSGSDAPATSGGGGTHSNLWRPDERFDLAVFASDNPVYDPAQLEATKFRVQKLSVLQWEEHDLRLGWHDDSYRQRNVTLSCTESLQRNGSLYAHIFLRPTRPGVAAIERSVRLNVYKPRPKLNTKQNLVSGEFNDEKVAAAVKENRLKELQEEHERDSTYLSYWQPLLHLRPLVDFTVFKQGEIPAPLRNEYVVDPQTLGYIPPLYIDYFWLLNDRRTLINESVSSLPLELMISPISMMKWQLQSKMEESFAQQMTWGSNEDDTESIRRMFMDTSPWLLLITFLVSILHTVFDVLAFKNDIQFWKENKSMAGLSVRTIFVNCFCQFFIFLYLLDNDTSWMIVMSSGVGMLIEFWKIKQAVDIKVDMSGRIPRISFTDKSSYSSETAEHDATAMKYLSWACYPCVIGYAIYSLHYNEYKSWYSFVLSTLTGCVYTFGFIMMCPQLYLNYKLKSVAHLPWRMLTYKALNTFIDDLFAFIITMPMMHRLSCFRDDIVFFVYLYQRWIYRIDYSRANEFGLIPDQPTDDAAAEPQATDAQDQVQEEQEEEEDKGSASDDDAADDGAGAGAAVRDGLRKRAAVRRPPAGDE